MTTPMEPTRDEILGSLRWSRMRFEVEATSALPLCLPEAVVRREIDLWHRQSFSGGGEELPVLVLPAAIHSAVGRELFYANRESATAFFKGDGESNRPAAILLDPLFEPENSRFEWPVRQAGEVAGVRLPENGLVFEPGERLSFSFTLIGPAADIRREIAEAVIRAGRAGIGGRLMADTRGTFEVKGAEDSIAPPLVMPVKSQHIRITFLSPWIGIDEPPTFETLWKAILNRHVRQLDRWYGDGRLEQWPYEPFADRNVVAQVHDQLSQTWLYRFPAFQPPSAKDLIEGFGGVIDYAGNLDDYLPLLQLAAELGVGQNTGMGCGRFYLESIA